MNQEQRVTSKTCEMESFDAKVRYGNGSHFDPMLEERGGWIYGEAQRHDVEMTDRCND